MIFRKIYHQNVKKRERKYAQNKHIKKIELFAFFRIFLQTKNAGVGENNVAVCCFSGQKFIYEIHSDFFLFGFSYIRNSSSRWVHRNGFPFCLKKNRRLQKNNLCPLRNNQLLRKAL